MQHLLAPSGMKATIKVAQFPTTPIVSVMTIFDGLDAVIDGARTKTSSVSQRG